MRERALELIAWSYAIWVERLILASLLVAGIVMALGGAWDAHWHATVGRDSLWVPPHMFVYSGSALAAVVAFLVGLRTGAEVGSANPLVMLRSLHFQGYRVVGIGSATIVGAAVFDGIWHRTIGDLVIWSPPHLMAVAGTIILGLGTLIALFQATRSQVLPPSWARAGGVVILASALVSAYFGLLPVAVMAFHPRGAALRFWTTTDPYVMAAVASLMIPAGVACCREILGRRGFEIVTKVGVSLWSVQEVFSVLATPLAAEQFGYVMRPYGLADFRFSLVLLGFMLLPAILVNRLPLRQPLAGGALLGMLYFAEVALWLGVLGIERSVSGLLIAGVITLGAVSAGSGILCGQWIRRAASIGNSFESAPT